MLSRKRIFIGISHLNCFYYDFGCSARNTKLGLDLFSTSGIAGNWSALLKIPNGRTQGFPSWRLLLALYTALLFPSYAGMYGRSIRQTVSTSRRLLIPEQASWLLGPSDSPSFVPQHFFSNACD